MHEACRRIQRVCMFDLANNFQRHWNTGLETVLLSLFRGSYFRYHILRCRL